MVGLQKREKGKMKIHHVQNIQRALDYLEKDCKIKLVNIGSGELYEGDSKLTLGLVWMLILHFQVLLYNDTSAYGNDQSSQPI